MLDGTAGSRRRSAIVNRNTDLHVCLRKTKQSVVFLSYTPVWPLGENVCFLYWHNTCASRTSAVPQKPAALLWNISVLCVAELLHCGCRETCFCHIRWENSKQQTPKRSQLNENHFYYKKIITCNTPITPLETPNNIKHDNAQFQYSLTAGVVLTIEIITAKGWECHRYPYIINKQSSRDHPCHISGTTPCFAFSIFMHFPGDGPISYCMGKRSEKSCRAIKIYVCICALGFRHLCWKCCLCSSLAGPWGPGGQKSRRREGRVASLDRYRKAQWALSLSLFLLLLLPLTPTLFMLCW